MPARRNRAKCLTCGEIIESRSRHSFVTCKCGNLSVDGGRAYVRRVFAEAFDGSPTYEELSEGFDE